MKSLKGTQTEKNILAAFAGESEARNRYDFFSGAARKEGYVQIADMFTETAAQEHQHAKRLFKFLEGGTVDITISVPAGVIGKTEANLLASVHGEGYESTHMYPEFAKIADAEGFPEVASVMRGIALAEAFHEKRFLAFAQNIKEGRVFAREKPVVWRCRNCGCPVEGAHAPEICPACAHPMAHFEVLIEPWI